MSAAEDALEPLKEQLDLPLVAIDQRDEFGLHGQVGGQHQFLARGFDPPDTDRLVLPFDVSFTSAYQVAPAARSASANTDKLVSFASTISSNIYGHARLPDIPVTKPTLDAKTSEVSVAIEGKAMGGPPATAKRNQRMEELVEMLAEISLYVQMRCANDRELVLSTGFHVASQSNAREQLVQPVIIRAKPGLSGQVIITVRPVPNARCYEVASANVTREESHGEWHSAPMQTDSRSLKVGALKSGELYEFRVRAIGGITGASDWSNTTSCRPS